MTKSTITREQLHERARENVKALKMASRQHAFESARQEILADLQLAELALAAMDSEPVAWMHNNNNIGIPAVTFSQKIGHNWMAKFKGVQPLYRHAQQPVVPDAEAVYARLSDHEKWSTSLENVNHVLNACRAAMLAASPLPPGRDPATVPGGWIPVSERMPEDAQWCAVITEYGYYVQCWSDGQGWLGDDISIPNVDVTHWMPLPAAPQEVKGE
ncbi:DUF551 domain-containing protein [Raoultella ornithinolytica]|uniref:DUF551 domain-containing protein n=1 Tax=Raoultella ornithinolytica TaxID=54291 RepID=UPI002DB563D1|nr:DUF551 domain-containing protein [Raoultella ornithinolytica]MEB8212219.1 DUF551 domain-containing protein [Raoultella ornithinolytica]